MLTAILSFSGALVFGTADFLGGIAAKRLGAVLATAVAAVIGLVLLLVAHPFVPSEWSASDVAWGAASGVCGAIAIGLLYACLAIGPMSILSPLTAVISAVVPMAWGSIVGGERFTALGWWAIALALVAVVLVGFVPEKGAVRPSFLGIAMAIGSGTAIGAFFLTIDQTADASGVVPLILNRGVNAAIMFTLVGVLAAAAVIRSRRTGHVPTLPDPRDRRVGLHLAVACGAVDVVANVLLLLGIRAGDLTVAAVLGALYPAGTILLAALVLRERIAPVQWAGLALALAAAAMLAVA